ncbi:IPT/TIG domain-containing protein [Kitasatospora purpeofusca]|uniref:IPT/TIG domain-containing protein n=1 Tax=Kitasatospora purpeofusca TaxID=67352 RepID=UPI0038216BA3
MSSSRHRRARPARPTGRSRRRPLIAAACSAALLVTGLVTLGAAPAQATAGGRSAYVTNLRGNSVSVVDTASGTVTATIPVGRFPEGVAVSPDASRVYVVNDGDNNVSVIDTATNTVTATVPVGAIPGPVAVSPDGSRLYVGNNIATAVGGITVIDTATNTVTATFATGSQPFGIAFAPDGAKAYVANFVGSSVSVVDTATSTVTATITDPDARTPAAVVVAPDGAHVYTANFNSNTVSVIDTATNTITALVPDPGGPEGIAIAPDGAHVYVANANAGNVAVIDTATNTVTGTTAVGSGPVGVAVDRVGGSAYVTNSGSNTVSVIDTATGTVTRTVPVGTTPFGVTVTPAPVAVTAITPTQGPASGGGTVTLTGTGLAGAGAVSFGGTPATDVTVVDDLTVTATVPAHAAGPVDVTVTTPAGTSPASAADRYTYFAPPTVTSVSPTSGPTAGGTPVTVHGTGLTGATALTFGPGSPATTLSCTSDTTCATVSPAHPAGPVDIQVTTPGGTSATSGADLFSYVPPTADLAVTVAGQPHLGILVPYLTYTLTARNNGPDPVTSATVTATLPPGAGATNPSPGCTATTHTVTCAYGGIASGASVVSSFRVPLGLLSLGPVQVTAVRTASAPTDTTPANDTGTATCTVVSLVLAVCP